MKVNEKNELYFIANYFTGVLNILASGLLLTLIPVFLINDRFVYILVLILCTIISYLLFNKKWIKNVCFDKNNKRIKIDYPLNVYGTRFLNTPFSAISKITYYGYMAKSPSHCKVNTNSGTLRFNCTKEEAKELSELLKEEDIEFLFDDEKEVGYR